MTRAALPCHFLRVASELPSSRTSISWTGEEMTHSRWRPATTPTSGASLHEV
jgi:hypothetical protein